MTLSEKQFIFSKNVALLLDYIHSHSFNVTFGEAFRTKEQAELYAKEGKGIADSLHCERLAIDLMLFDSNGKYLTNMYDYRPFGIYWESLHPLNRWGGNFHTLVDSDHFEMQNK